jgi:hypothetical protein
LLSRFSEKSNYGKTGFWNRIPSFDGKIYFHTDGSGKTKVT